MARKIKEEFLNELSTGSLISFLKYVQVDDTLNMELRGDRITVYYRGGAILTIYQDTYIFGGISKQYHKGISFILPSITNFEEYFPKAKHIIDVYINTERNHLGEKDIQQQIARENNYSPNSIDTDYFVIDTEYQDMGRFDIVALRWDSMGHIRKLPKSFLPTITIFEVKQGYNSLSGRSGMVSHIKDFEKFLSTKNMVLFKSDMISVFDQKRRLGLIKCMGKYKEVKEVAPAIDFVFLLVNFKHDSNQLLNAFKVIKDCRLIYANHMGYGLYARNILNKKQFIKKFL
ncbi:MAG: hypothetical protein Q8M94_10845 [Ignavibacteria bacterium]|nr:hypothetical protein [Ignavibacteria bacterium]